MPIIGKVGRKSTKVKILNISIHIVLLLGAITMIYPFMMMISASFKSNVDSINFSLYPEYFFDDEILFKKFVESRYNEESNQMIENYKNRFIAFEQVEKPRGETLPVFEDWMQYLEETGSTHSNFDYYISEQFGRGVYPRNERTYRNFMKFSNYKSIDTLNLRFNTSAQSWDEVRIEEKEILSRNYVGSYNGFLKPYKEFREDLPLWHRSYATADGNFIKNELKPAYKNNLALLNQSLGTNYSNWDQIILTPELDNGPLHDHWINYVKYQLNLHQITIKSDAVKQYRNFLLSKYNEIELLNETYNSKYKNFSDIEIPSKLPDSGAKLVDLTFFVERIVSVKYLQVATVEMQYREWLKRKYGEIANLNNQYQKGFSGFHDIPLDTEFPTQSLRKQDTWMEFVRSEINPEEIRLLPLSQTEYLNLLATYFPGNDDGLDLDKVNALTGMNYKKSLNVYPAKELPESRDEGEYSYRDLWLEFVRDHVSGRFLTIKDESSEIQWQHFLEQKYGEVSQLNQDWGLIFGDFNSVPIDNFSIDYEIFKHHNKDILKEFVKRNYVMVLDLMFYNGRAVVNTLIYCLLAIFTAIIINPLAAYAMSRFKLKATFKILLILMLTMAFPPMVMGIPSFLLLKKFNMLNTFFALILPAAADGYFIFLLKGFFDSLPKELFESATIDGAGETRIFWQIAMSLSKPIMAVIALGAFNAAYRNFMFAFIVCQDKSMWTMMVHIYQLIQRSSPGVGFAALVIAAIPTFAVFVFFQNIIIRGIVVPTEK